MIATSTTTATTRHYLPPGRIDDLTGRAIRRLVRMGVSVWGARELRIVGRRSGLVRSNVVNLLEVDGARYLVAPRGTTQWVRNLRAAGQGQLRVGRRSEDVTASEVADDAIRVAVLRAYLDRWAWEVGRFFDGVDASSSDEALAEIAPDHPIFVVSVAV